MTKLPRTIKHIDNLQSCNDCRKFEINKCALTPKFEVNKLVLVPEGTHKFWFIGGGICKNEQSEHYGHMLDPAHPSCDKFIQCTVIQDR